MSSPLVSWPQPIRQPHRCPLPPPSVMPTRHPSLYLQSSPLTYNPWAQQYLSKGDDKVHQLPKKGSRSEDFTVHQVMEGQWGEVMCLGRKNGPRDPGGDGGERVPIAFRSCCTVCLLQRWRSGQAKLAIVLVLPQPQSTPAAHLPSPAGEYRLTVLAPSA